MKLNFDFDLTIRIRASAHVPYLKIFNAIARGCTLPSGVMPSLRV